MEEAATETIGSSLASELGGMLLWLLLCGKTEF